MLGPTGNYQSALRNITEERQSHQHPGGSLKSRTLILFCHPPLDLPGGLFFLRSPVFVRPPPVRAAYLTHLISLHLFGLRDFVPCSGTGTVQTSNVTFTIRN